MSMQGGGALRCASRQDPNHPLPLIFIARALTELSVFLTFSLLSAQAAPCHFILLPGTYGCQPILTADSAVQYFVGACLQAMIFCASLFWKAIKNGTKFPPCRFRKCSLNADYCGVSLYLEAGDQFTLMLRNPQQIFTAGADGAGAFSSIT